MRDRDAYEVKNKEIQKLLYDIGVRIKVDLPTGWGFNLLIFEFGEGGALFYIADAEREQMIDVLEEYLAKLRASLEKE